MRKTRLLRAFFFSSKMISSWEASEAADVSVGGGVSSYGNAVVVVGDVTMSMRIYAGVYSNTRTTAEEPLIRCCVCRHQKTPFARNVYLPRAAHTKLFRSAPPPPVSFCFPPPRVLLYIRLHTHTHTHRLYTTMYITLARHYCCTIYRARANGLVSVVGVYTYASFPGKRRKGKNKIGMCVY